MKLHQSIGIGESLSQQTALFALFAITAGLCVSQPIQAATNLVVWDTGSRFADTVNLDDKTGWKAVPTDLLMLEASPPKAASDPGYYGRDYTFKGDAVVENRSLAAVFWAAKGRVVIYSKTDTGQPLGTSPRNTSPARKIAEFAPLQTKTQPTTISRSEILHNAGDEVALEISFSQKGSAEVSAVFSFGKTEIVAVKPAANLKGISLLSPLEYGVVPSFVGDDLVFAPGEYPMANTLCIPSENFFLGLLKGEDSVLVMTWPKGKQQMRLQLGTEQPGKRVIESIDFDHDGQSFYLAALGAPGIWHREELKPSYLEKDVAIQWKKPFSATWKTQLSEAGVKTAFAFRESKGQIWRGVPGSYIYPVWFNGDNAFYRLNKKVPPKGESIIYYLEGNDTPAAISTPVDILKATLGGPMADATIDVAGRKLRTHHRRGGEGIRRACTCGATEAIEAVFKAGEEVAKKEYVEGAVADMVYFVQRHVGRIDEYRRFADDLIQFVRTQASSAPELKPHLEHLEPIAQQIPQECSVQKENMKSLAYADELARQTVALAGRKDPKNLRACLDLGKAWRDMGGAQDYVLAQCHTITRKLFQEAGYRVVDQPKAMELAQEIRRRCRETLRNPDGYEIWANY